MPQDIQLWALCQRFFNVTPVLVEDRRSFDIDGTVSPGGSVRFLATVLSRSSGLEDLYDAEDILAIGFEDENNCNGWAAVEDYFADKPCIAVVRLGPSYFDYNSCSLDITIYLDATDETRRMAIATVQGVSQEGVFTDYWRDRQPAATQAEELASSKSLKHDQPLTPPQGQSLFDRWFGAKHLNR